MAARRRQRAQQISANPSPLSTAHRIQSTTPQRPILPVSTQPTAPSSRRRHGLHLWQETQDLCIVRPARRPRPRSLRPVQPARLGPAARRWALGQQERRVQAGQRAVHESDADRRRHAGTGVKDADVQHADHTAPADRGQRAGTARRRVATVERELCDGDRPEPVARVPGDALAGDVRVRSPYAHLRSHDQQQELRVHVAPPCADTGHTVTRVWNAAASIRRRVRQESRDVVDTEHVLGEQHV